MNGNKNFKRVYQTNPYYNSEMSGNGGGYFQALTIIQYGDWTLKIEDTSCGDFGDRIYTKIYYKGEEFDNSIYNEMDDIWCPFQKRSSKLIYAQIMEQDIKEECFDYQDYCKDILNCNKSSKLEPEEDLIFWEE